VDALVLDWLSLGLRWTHLVVAIGWIGASLYFMWLDATIAAPARPREGVEGELWLVHSGGFYLVEKRRPAPAEMPATLHWFKWEAALTAITGFLLLSVVYYSRPAAYMVDPAVLAIAPGAAVALGIGLFAVAWVVYDVLWISPLARTHGRAVTALSWALLLAVAWGLCHVLSGRAAYLHVGAMMGIIMAVNVWVRVLPAQRQMIGAARAGRPADFTLGAVAKRRSTHNSYMTFPVIFTMFSNHYPGTYGHPLNWLVLWLLIAVGAGIRHAMILREHGRPAGWVWAPVAAALAALLYLTSPAWLTSSSASTAPVSFQTARSILDRRCLPCHSKQPTDDVFRVAPSNVTFDTPASIVAHADTIKLRTVTARTMPLANKTGMTDAERDLLGRWIDQGARLQ
jgi:uncharacterized membrane protein